MSNEEKIITNSGRLRLEFTNGDLRKLAGPGEWVRSLPMPFVHRFSGTIMETRHGHKSGRAVCGQYLPYSDWGLSWGLSTDRDRCHFCDTQTPSPHGDGCVYPVPEETPDMEALKDG